MEDSVNVGIRVRPSSNVFDQSIAVSVVSDNPPVLHVINKQLYSFDHIFGEDASQEKVYNIMVKPLVQKVLQGYNCTIFAYGQTGSGKTYTIGSHPKGDAEAGFIARLCDELFSNREEYRDMAISINYYEIYNEKVFDLLSDKKEPLLVKGFKVDGLETIHVHNQSEAAQLLAMGSLNRHTGETKQNRYSSRSHAIFTLTCVVKNEICETEAKLNLVDLAGSESVRKTGTEGSQFQEGININKGLFYVGRVINALTTNMVHVPYRQSMITTILQDSLSKRNFITLVACVSPDLQDVHETIQTLEFAQGTKKVKNKPEVNNAILEYKKNNPTLFERPIPTSAAKVRSTPLKRQNHSMDCAITPGIVKKPKPNHTWTPCSAITECEIQTPPSLSAMSVASTLRDGRFVLSSLSPIVQKCTEVVENKIMEKFQLLMKPYTYRSTPEKPKTPQFSWQRLHSEVTQIVRNEFVQLTSQRSHTSSSPIETSGDSNVAKRLDFDDDSSFVFKLPEKPPPKLPRKKAHKNETELDQSIQKAPRRSMRLSMKMPPLTFVVQSGKRKSLRLMDKNQAGVSPERHPQRIISKRPPIPTPRTKPSTSNTISLEDAKIAHCNNILNILNNGNEKELQKLPSVGLKTAKQIYLYRQLHGPLNNIKDLSKMQSWMGNQYQRFLRSNLLNISED
ncbi:hypothetical protein RI129_010982 [Pyrocoelia pectoralis]|uniref:Kinesin-like protein n=1 Tax=Pyrocoelia pectoralis TaxID=417401 RepID=A0AAN7V804_9COLE